MSATPAPNLMSVPRPAMFVAIVIDPCCPAMAMISAGANASLETNCDGSGLKGDELFEEVGKFVVENLGEPAEGSEQNDVFSSLESGLVLAALRRTRGNKQAAANLLGLYRPRLYGMIKRHNLEERV